jgi:hypothetical protein
VNAIVRILLSGEWKVPVGKYHVCIWIPHPTVKRDCVGVWLPTTIVWRADCWHAYQWAAGFRILGFGLGIGRNPNISREPRGSAPGAA